MRTHRSFTSRQRTGSGKIISLNFLMGIIWQHLRRTSTRYCLIFMSSFWVRLPSEHMHWTWNFVTEKDWIYPSLMLQLRSMKYGKPLGPCRAPCPADKVPGPDGYTGRFYKACWSVIKSDFMAAILTLQQGDARGLGLLNAAYITLIPKKVDANTARDFRPISLVHSFAKLITKILANRLAP
jgi:hypothetical protein